MPIAISAILQVALIVHVIKTDRPYYWIFIIMMPGIGALAYIIVELMPEFLDSWQGRRAVRGGGAATRVGPLAGTGAGRPPQGPRRPDRRARGARPTRPATVLGALRGPGARRCPRGPAPRSRPVRHSSRLER